MESRINTEHAPGSCLGFKVLKSVYDTPTLLQHSPSLWHFDYVNRPAMKRGLFTRSAVPHIRAGMGRRRRVHLTIISWCQSAPASSVTAHRRPHSLPPAIFMPNRVRAKSGIKPGDIIHNEYTMKRPSPQPRKEVTTVDPHADKTLSQFCSRTWVCCRYTLSNKLHSAHLPHCSDMGLNHILDLKGTQTICH